MIEPKEIVLKILLIIVIALLLVSRFWGFVPDGYRDAALIAAFFAFVFLFM